MRPSKESSSRRWSVVRAHPTDLQTAIGGRDVVCGACHDSTDALAHVAVQTESAGNKPY